jgi:hypothetical protein
MTEEKARIPATRGRRTHRSYEKSTEVVDVAVNVAVSLAPKEVS